MGIGSRMDDGVVPADRCFRFAIPKPLSRGEGGTVPACLVRYALSALLAW